jgi:hypothetical protein
MSVTIVKGVTLATFAASKGSGTIQKPAASGAFSAEKLSAQAAARTASDVTVAVGRRGAQGSDIKIRDHVEAQEKAEEVAEHIREEEELGDEAHGNLDPSLVSDGIVV